MNQRFESNFGTVAGLEFDHFLRTGRRDSGRFGAGGIEHKFNPNHDPNNGRFTSGAGAAGGSSSPNFTEKDGGAGRSDGARAAVKPASGGQEPDRPAKRDSLFELSERYEADAKSGVGTVSSGKNDSGGISYGRFQLATNTGTADDFAKSPEAKKWAKDFQGLKPGTPQFGAAWKAVAARDPDAFGEAQDAYIRRTHYKPAVRKIMQMTGFDVDGSHDAVRQVTYSLSVQHGRAAMLFSDAVRRSDAMFVQGSSSSAKDSSKPVDRQDPAYLRLLINNIYDRRTEYVRGLQQRALKEGRASDARGFENIIKNRYPKERADALEILGSKPRSVSGGGSGGS